MNGGPSGFNNAPITRAFVTASGLFTIVFGIINRRSNKLGLSYQDLFTKLQVWKLLSSIFAFSSTPESLFGLYLLYYFRVFERQIGSNKYSVFVVFSVAVSIMFEVLALTFLKDPKNVLTSGPYGLIFSSFVPFYLDIPVSTQFRVFGIRFSNKTFTYLAGLQLLLSSGRRSFLPGVCGIVAGILYRLNILRIRRLKFPDSVASFFSRISWPSTISTPSAPSRNIIGNLPSHTARQPEGNLPAPVLGPIETEPPEETIATLVSMGFDRNSARQALMHARNDINTATNILLEAQSH